MSLTGCVFCSTRSARGMAMSSEPTSAYPSWWRPTSAACFRSAITKTLCPSPRKSVSIRCDPLPAVHHVAWIVPPDYSCAAIGENRWRRDSNHAVKDTEIFPGVIALVKRYLLLKICLLSWWGNYACNKFNLGRQLSRLSSCLSSALSLVCSNVVTFITVSKDMQMCLSRLMRHAKGVDTRG